MNNENDNKKNEEQTKENLYTIKNYTSFKRNRILPNIRKAMIKTKAIRLLKELDKKKENNSIFLTQENNSQNKIKTKRFRNINNSLIKPYYDKGSKVLEEFNVFGSEDNFIKGLMEKFNNKAQSKMPKPEKKKEVLNNLYGINPQFSERMKIAKRNKKLSLEEYQANTFKIFATNDIGKTELFDLAYNLKHLRLESESVSPLPPININIIYDHVKRSNSNKEKKINKMTIKELINKTDEPKDEFEKEEKLIKKMMSYKAVQRRKRNKALDILPEYVKNVLSKRFKSNA